MDFNTTSSGTIEQFTAVLKSTTNGNSETSSSQGSANITLPPTAHLHYRSSSNTPRPTSNSVNCHTPACDSQITSRTTNISSKPSFLELCVNTGPYLMSLAEIDTANILTDGDLFRDLRRQYLRLRRYRSRFWLLKPAAVSFVRVSSLIHVN